MDYVNKQKKKRSLNKSLYISLYTPSSLYRRRKEKYSQICYSLREKALDALLSTNDIQESVSEKDLIPISQEKYINELRQQAKKSVLPPLISSWENKILSLIPKQLRKKFPNILNIILEECKDEWSHHLHDLMVKTIIRDVPGIERETYTEKGFRYGGKTANYAKFLEIRRILSQKLLILHPLIRKIIGSGVVMFPEYLVDFNTYRYKGFMDLASFAISFKNDLKMVEHIIVNEWYPQLASFVKTYLASQSSQKFLKGKGLNLLDCGSKFIAMQVTELIQRTIDLIIKVTGNPENIPLINIELNFNLQISLKPSLAEIFDTYHEFLTSTVAICQRLTHLESFHTPIKKYIVIQLNEWTYKNCHKLLQENLDKNFEFVQNLVKHLKVEYKDLIEDYDKSDHIGEFYTDEQFENSYKKLKYYKTIYENVSSMVNNEYFNAGKLQQMKLIEGLKSRCMLIQDEILENLCSLHKENSKRICEEFEEIARRVLAIPKDASELIAIDAYNVNAKTNLIDNLKGQITDSVITISKLIDLTSLSSEHISINCKMINWLNEITPILEKSTVDCETTKYEMEEALVVKTNILGKKISDLLPYLDILDEMDDINNTLSYLEDIRRLVHWINDCEKDVSWINKEETVFKFPVSQYPDWDELKNYVFPFYELIYLLHKWRRSYFSWMDGPFEYIDNTVVEKQHEMYYKEFTKTFKEYKKKIKQQISDGNERRFRGLVEDPDPMNLPAPMKLCAQALNELKECKPWIQLINIMCNPALQQRHWDEMSKIAGFDLTPDAGTTIRKMTKFNLMTNIQEYDIVSIGARKELHLITNLKAMVLEWKDVKFKFDYYEGTNISILTELDPIYALLNDHIMKTVNMRGSSFAKPFENEVKSWHEKLIRISTSLDNWVNIQAKLFYCRPLFSSKSIFNEMPNEGNIFLIIEETYHKYINIALNNPSVIEFAEDLKFLEAIEMINGSLEKVNVGINKYIEKKRLLFSRFYFLSVDEISYILSQVETPSKVCFHLKKCFEGISDLTFDLDMNITEMINEEGERIKFCNKVSTEAAQGYVEKWLFDVEQEMIKTIRNNIKMSYLEYAELEKTEWIRNWGGMIILCVSQIYWVADTINCFRNTKETSLVNLYESLKLNLNKIIRLMHSDEVTNLLKSTIKSLIIIDIHARDVVQKLISENVYSDTDFNWLAQLRYYWINDDVSVQIINSTVEYGYEYLGNVHRLVITPLTERCYRTLIGAYSLHLSGALEGPTAGGKTETVKDLARAVAKQSIIFNCSDGLDYKSMRQFFKGIASSGAWACFDECNRIETEVLSVIAQQISCVAKAIRSRDKKFNFEGTNLLLNSTCFICITMNPNYSKRSELPDNLKVLFRTIVMMIPDCMTISEVFLYSCGFLNAKNLAIKLVTVYHLCSEQLSSQNHYDFGMRAIKSVLSTCSKRKLQFCNENEDTLLLKCINDVNKSKLISHDIQLYEGIISDIFPGVTVIENEIEKLKQTVEIVCTNMNLYLTNYFTLKITQTYQMLNICHGIMVVGNPYSGKTTILKVLYETLRILTDHPEFDGFKVINPKSIAIDRLFGAYNNYLLWEDGIISNIFRNFSNKDSLGIKWIIFDGPVDSSWVENLNSVLDDNKKLCLASGEIIHANNVSVIFEVMDLLQASPAIVSRCGMVYVESNSLGPTPFVKSWIKNCNPKWKDGYEELLFDMCEWLFPLLLAFIKKFEPSIMTGGEINMIIMSLFLINSLMTDAVNAEEDSKYLKVWIQASFIFGILWGFGSNIQFNSRGKLDEYIKELFKGEQQIPSKIEKIEVSIPSEGLLFDYTYQYKQKGIWKPWHELVKNIKIKEVNNLNEILIPSVDSLKISFFLDIHIRYNKHMTLIGPSGSGKTFYLKEYLNNKLSLDKYTPIYISFTANTNARVAQELVLSKLQKKKTNFYGASNNTNVILFIDDINMLSKESYDVLPAIELLRHYLNYHYFYDLTTSQKIYLTDILILSTIGLVGGNRQIINPRMLRHFNLFATDEYSEDITTRIFLNLLQIGMNRNGFGSDALQFMNSAISGTFKIYSSVKKELLPTCSKPHYMFNLRDFFRIIQGCVLVKKDSVDSKKYLFKLWIHETLRVFYDRLNNDNDKQWFFSLLKKCTEDCFKDSLNNICDNYVDENGDVTEETLKRLMFGTYLDGDISEEERKYEEIPNLQIVCRKVTSAIDEYNATNKNKINIVLFQYALEHLSRICRIMSIAGGNALLIGISGSGKQTLSKLACIMTGKLLFQPDVVEDYNFKCWRNDLKKLLKQVGGFCKETIFLLTENQITDESFLQDIDILLSSGEIPTLFDLEEQQEILELVRLDAQGGNRNLDVSASEVLKYFNSRCKAKLHTCICLSPVEKHFNNKLKFYPSLINYCTIDWFDCWPQDALQRVAKHYLENIDLSDSVKLSIENLHKHFHSSVYSLSENEHNTLRRKVYITSGRYLHLVNLFSTLIEKKQNELSLAKQRYINGLDKLNMAADAVSNMQQELNELKPQLLIMAVKGTDMMEEIERETIEADKATVLVREDEKIANEQAAAAQALKKECEADLALAIPILEDAIEALNTLKPTDITLVKAMKNPPAAIKLVMAAVCVMKSIPPDRLPDPTNPGRMTLDFWGPSKRLLGDMAFLQNLKEFDKDNIPATTMSKIRKEYLPHKDFKPHIIAKASAAAEGLCKWVIAMDMYDAVAKIVAPKKAKLLAAEAEFAATMAILDEKKAMVTRLEKRVADLNASLEEANLKKQKLEEEVELCISKLYRAEKLIGGLGGEKSRWTKAAENLQFLYDNLAGDIALSCGIISYLSLFSMDIRNSILNNWKEQIKQLDIPFSDDFLFSNVLGDGVKIQNWYIFGLPRDQISTDNAIIQDCSMKWSLLIDPQNQAYKWIKNMEEKNGLCIFKLTDKNFVNQLKNSIQNGYPILIENIQNELPTLLNPILSKSIYSSNGKEFITYGNLDIEYNKSFRLYITTKLTNPNFHAEVYNKMTIIDFALSIDGLEDQLLGIVVAKERPDLQEKREKLMVENAKNETALKKTEENILRTLQESKGDILEDEAAIEILDSSKISFLDFTKRKETMKETEQIINKFRYSYLPVAKHCANLYYVIVDLPFINSMYQFSLNWFTNLYIFSIKNSNVSKILDKRLKFLNDTFTYNLYCNVCRSLFDKDKLIFSFILCYKILMISNSINEGELKFLLTSGTQIKDDVENPFTWLPMNSWNELYNISNLSKFESLKTSFINDSDQWKKIYESKNPYLEDFPKPLNESLTPFQKLLLIKTLRPDTLNDTITWFVESNLTKKFIKPPSFDIKQSYIESNCLTPLIFILSPELDPTESLMKFSEKMGQNNKFNILSLGQGQGPIAKTLIEEAQVDGGWVCLQNCHLATSWLIELENIIESFSVINTDLSFRLWLTTNQSEKIPQSILLSSIKIINESPSGFKNSIVKLYASEPIKNPSFYGGCPGKYREFTKLLFGISFFHAIIQERKRFEHLGWNVPYAFNFSDFYISIVQLQIFLNEYNDVPYDALLYLIGECNYGGRISNDWDNRLIKTILKDCINSQVVEETKYKFSESHQEYILPTRYEYQDFLKHIDQIPDITPPEIFGLNTNSVLFRDYNTSMDLINSLSKVYLCSPCDSLEQIESYLKDTCNDIIGKMPSYFDIENAKKKYPINNEKAINIVLIQELERYNKLMHTIKSSLVNILKNITGYVSVNVDIEDEMSCINSGKIPNTWKKNSYLSCKPLASYISDLLERLNMFKVWLDEDEPSVYWISGFFSPHAFLTGQMQNYVRKTKLSIEKLTFDCEIITNIHNDVLKDDFFVKGLFINGARWDNKQLLLDEQYHNVSNESMPIIRIFFLLKSDFCESNRYECPIYTIANYRHYTSFTNDSNNFVTSLMIPSDKPNSHWIKRDVKMLFQLND